MEVTLRLIGIALVATLFIASSNAQIIVQPGYSQPRYGHQSYTESPMQHQSPAVMYQQPRAQQLSLADEFQRNQVLQRMIENQILQMVHEHQAQQLGQMPPGMVGLPLLHFPLRPRIGGGKLFSLTPSGIRGLHLGGYGLTRRPLLLREASQPREQGSYEGRTQWPRSVSGADFGVGSSQVHDVASGASVDGDSVNGVDDLPEPQALVAEDSTDKLVEPRHTGEPDDAVVGSPLDRIHYDQPYNHEQHHPMNSPAMSSQFMKTAHAVGEMIDTVASGLTNPRSGYENKDPISSMTRHQDPTGNYQQHSQFQPLSRQGERNESPNNWNSPSTSSNNEPMTGQSFDGQKPQNSEWSSMAPAQNSQNPSAKASENDRHSQKPPASYPAINNPVSNWLTSAKQIFSGQPAYQNYQNPGYNNNNYRPGYQNYQNRPLNGGYRPNYNGPFSYNYGPSRPTSTASASATSSANSYNYYNPYQRSPYNNNPYVGYSPYGFTGAIDQFGRTILSQLPASISSFIANPNNMAYLRNMAGQQLTRNYY